jgi:hypothetical protein
MLLNPTPINSSKFSFKNSTFVAEMSSLGDPKLDRVYDDAADYGFTIISAKTGNPAVFVFVGYDRCGEDIAGLRFTCVTPGLKNLKALLIND